MNYNYFPNTVLDFRSKEYDQLYIYNVNSKFTDENRIEEINRVISFILKLDYSKNNIDLSKSIVYDYVDINNNNFYEYNKNTSLEIKKTINKHYYSDDLKIYFYLSKKKLVATIFLEILLIKIEND
jgi:hypothetical protein